MKSTPELKREAQKVFNAFIRLRDEGKRCISCNGRDSTMQAGHYFSAGKYNILRFNEDNCHLQCVECNCYKEGNLEAYKENLIKKIGEERFAALELLSETKVFKDDRSLFLDIIETYNNKILKHHFGEPDLNQLF